MSEDKEFSASSSVKECPVCGGKLVKGYFNAPRGVYWDTVKHKMSAIAVDTMMPRVSSVIALRNIPALRCEKCEIAIFDYSHAGGTPKSFMKECIKCGKEIPIASEKCSYCGANQTK